MKLNIEHFDSLGWIFLKQSMHQISSLIAHGDTSRKFETTLRDAFDDFAITGAIEGQLSKEKRVNDDTKSPHIDFGIWLSFAADQL